MRLKKIIAMGGLVAALGAGGRLAMLPAVRSVAKVRLREYEPRAANISYGRVTYVEEGRGIPLLMSHGLYGGYDQGVDAARALLPHNTFRVISPSRFGYPGSSVKGSGNPREQAEAFVELLDHLGVEKTFVMGNSAGGTAVIRMALDYPERVHGLILFSSSSPRAAKPVDEASMMGPLPALNRDWFMWLAAPIFPIIYGMPPNVVHTMLPIGPRREGVAIDTFTTNPDMGVHFDDYPIEALKVPVLLIHAKDDRTAPFSDTEASMHRYPHLTTAIFETGGHMQIGNETAIADAIQTFTTALVM